MTRIRQIRTEIRVIRSNRCSISSPQLSHNKIMNDNTSPEPEKSDSQSYLKYLLLYALLFTAMLAASFILFYSINAFTKYTLGLDFFSPSLFGLSYLALFVFLLARTLRKLTRRVMDTEKQLNASQQKKFIPVRIVLATLAIVPVFGLLFYTAPLDPFGVEKQQLDKDLLQSLKAWSNADIDDYDLDLSIHTPLKDCPPSSEVRLSVRQGTLVQVLDLQTHQAIPIGAGQCGYTNFTINGLFRLTHDIVQKYDAIKDYLSIDYSSAFGSITDLYFEHCESHRLFNYDRGVCENTIVFSSRFRWDNALTTITSTLSSSADTSVVP